MYLYTVAEAVVAVIAGILIAVCTKKKDGVIYGKLDKIGQVTNIFLLLFYVGFSYVYLFLGMIANPRYDGFLGILGWTVSVVMASAALFCGVGLGLSVAFRKRGRSCLSFAVQFLGVGGIGLTVALFFCLLWESAAAHQLKKELYYETNGFVPADRLPAADRMRQFTDRWQ